jgi:polyferredoxin
VITIDWHPSSAHLRRWAVLTALALGLVGCLFRFVDWGVFAQARGLSTVLWSFGAFALLTAGTGTRAGMPAYWAWMGFVWVVGTVVGTVSLAIVFYGVITPLGLVARLAGRDRLQLRPPAGSTLWVDLPVVKHDPERQF